MLHLLHGTLQSIVSVGIFVSSRFEFYANLSSYSCPHLLRLFTSQILYSVYNFPQFPRLELESSTGTWTHISVMIKTCSFYNSQACKQIMCSIRFRHFSIFYVIKMHKIEA